MGFRLKRSLKIAPGVRVNFSKNGVSTSIGGKGATINIRGDKIRTTVGLPGTGISYSKQVTVQEHPEEDAEIPEKFEDRIQQRREANKTDPFWVTFWIIISLILVIMAILKPS